MLGRSAYFHLIPLLVFHQLSGFRYSRRVECGQKRFCLLNHCETDIVELYIRRLLTWFTITPLNPTIIRRTTTSHLTTKSQPSLKNSTNDGRSNEACCSDRTDITLDARVFANSAADVKIVDGLRNYAAVRIENLASRRVRRNWSPSNPEGTTASISLRCDSIVSMHRNRLVYIPLDKVRKSE
jgi:hypothetical protein